MGAELHLSVDGSDFVATVTLPLAEPTLLRAI
jgi:hypothetical protein